MSVEHLDEAAHVGAFEFLGQIHKHPDRRDRVLHRPRLVPHLDRETQPSNAHFINAQLAMIALTLLVVQFPACLTERPRPAILTRFKHL